VSQHAWQQRSSSGRKVGGGARHAMDEQRQNRLVLGMMSEDEATASSSAEELVDLLWADSEHSEARQEEIGAAEGLRAGLVNMLCTGLEDAQYWACLALSYVAHRHSLNIARIGRQPRIFEGLNRCLGFLETKGVACGVLSQLAFCNTYNSNAIAETEGLLQRIVSVMGSPRESERHAATCALSNCAANSKRVARQIVSVDGMLDALKTLCRPPAWLGGGAGEEQVQGGGSGGVEEEEGDSDDDDDECRTVISAIGCLDNLSHYPEVRLTLQRAEVEAVLLHTIQLVTTTSNNLQGPIVIAAESAMVLTRLLPLQRLEALNLPRVVLQTTMHCTLCAIDRRQWANFAWRLADVLEPLARLSLCPAYRSALCDCGATLQILRAVAATRRHSGEDGALERLHHCLVALCLLSQIPAAREVLLNGEITAKDPLWDESKSVAGSPAESLLNMDSSDPAQLTETKAQHEDIISQLEGELQATNEQLSVTQADLIQTQGELERTTRDLQGDLAGKVESIGVVEQQLAMTQSQLDVRQREQEWGLTGSPRNLSALHLLDGKHSQKSSMW
jgi:hypothetical protein